MNLSAYNSTATPPSSSDTREFLILSTMTCCLHVEEALNPYGAFGRWTRHHSIEERLLSGRRQQDPFPHLEILLEVETRPEKTMHDVYVARKRVLEAPWPEVISDD